MTRRNPHTALRSAAAVALSSSIALTGCASGERADAPAAPGAGSSEQTLTVFAAASLTDVFAQLERDFEAVHPGVDVVVTTAGSSDLVAQIGQGAPADVLATADQRNMDTAIAEKLIAGDPTLFANNELTIAVPVGNPEQITGVADLAKEGVAVVRCAVPVPCGNVTDKVLADAGVTVSAVSEENSVTDVLGKVTSGEADAGLVYVTDVARSKGRAEAVAIPQAAAHCTQYPIALVEGSRQTKLAQEFIELVTGPKGKRALAEQGFGTP